MITCLVAHCAPYPEHGRRVCHGHCLFLGIGLIFLLTRPQVMHRLAKVLVSFMVLSFLGWLFLPVGALTPWLGLVFGLLLGGCSGIAIFGYTYALNDVERLVGASITVLFSLSSQIIFSLPALWHVSGPLFLGAQVLVTFLCLFQYRPQDYLDRLEKDKETGRKLLAVVLFFFFAHRAVSFFYSYLPHALPNPAIGLVGIAVFLVTIYIFLRFRFNTWHLCNLFFVGVLITYILRLTMPEAGGLLSSDILQGFSHMGYIASYYLLGYAFSRYADYRRFRLLILILFNSSLVLHLLPSFLNHRVPQHMPLIGGALTLGLFVVFALLSPVFSKVMFVDNDREADLEVRRDQLMQNAGLTSRETEIVHLMLTGKMLKECAADLGISVDTVKFHTRNIYRKLGIQGRSELQRIFTES